MTTLTAATPTMGGPMAAGGRPRPAPAAPTGFTGADVLRVIRQRLVLIIALWLLFIGMTAVFTFLMIQYYPSFYTFAFIEVESVNPVDPLNPLQQGEGDQQEIERAVKNEALRITSPTVLGETLKERIIWNTRWHAKAKEDAAFWGKTEEELLAEIVSATPIPNTSYVRVDGYWEDPKEIETIVSTLVSKYLTHVRDAQQVEIRELAEQLTKEVEQKGREFNSKQDEIQGYRADNNVLGTGNEPNERLMTLIALVTELEVDKLGKQAVYDSLRFAAPEDVPLPPDMQLLLENDYDLRRYEFAVEEAEMVLAMRRATLGPNHRMIKDLEKARDVSMDLARETRAEKLVRYQGQMIDTARTAYLDANGMLLQIMDKLAEARAEQRDRDKHLATYMRMLEERDMLRFQLEQLQQSKAVVDMQSRNQQAVRISQASAPFEPRHRSSPRWEIWMPVGGVLGLLVSVGFAILLEVADKSVRTPRDVARHVAMPVLGTIPTSDDDEIEIERVETASVDAPHSIVAEAFRQLRANLFFTSPAEQQGVLLVTSPSGGNGKTTVATNLAISIALSGRRVLLVDANFRRPDLPRIFPQIRDEGLSNILIGQSRLADLVTSTSVPGLDVLGTGPTPPNPAELLGSSYLRDIVVDARAQYDQVIFDGPPTLLVSDTLVLAGAVDGVLLVCQYRATSRGALQRARNQLETIGSRIFGAVLNMVETRAGGYFRKQYREFYEYHEQEEDEGGRRPKKQLDAGQAAAVASGRAGREADVEPEPEDDEPAGASAARTSDDIGDIEIDERMGLGGDTGSDTAAEPSRPPASDDDELRFNPDVGLGDDLGLDDDLRPRDDDLGWADEDDEGPSGGRPKA